MGDASQNTANINSASEIIKQGNNFPINPKTEKPIVYISSYLLRDLTKTSSFDFFVQIITNMSKELHKLNFDLIVKVPTDLNPTQGEILEYVFKNKDLYNAVVIAPTSSSEIIATLKELFIGLDKAELKKCPIITIDKKLGEKIMEFSIPYFTSNWEKGGELAAEILTDHFNSLSKCLFLILVGSEGSEPRIRGFKNKIKQINTLYGQKQCVNDALLCSNECKEDCKFKLIDSEELDFSREGAKDYVLKHFHSKYKNIDGIFSCNDEMALGAREAFIKLNEIGKMKDIKIVGFDGINEVKNYLLDSSERYLIGTIDVRIYEQVQRVIDYLSSTNRDKFPHHISKCDKITKSSL